MGLAGKGEPKLWDWEANGFRAGPAGGRAPQTARWATPAERAQEYQGVPRFIVGQGDGRSPGIPSRRSSHPRTGIHRTGAKGAAKSTPGARFQRSKGRDTGMTHFKEHHVR